MRTGEHRVLLLDENNQADRWVQLAEAVASGRAFTVAYRSSLVVFDGDRDDALGAAISLADAAESAGIGCMIWASGRPGHVQVILSLPPDAKRGDWKAQGERLGLEPRTRSRPPLSPHRHGLPVRLVRPAAVWDVINLLAPPPWVKGWSEGLTPRTWARIRNGDPEARTESEAVYRIACGMISKGWQPEHAFRVLMDERNVGGRGLRQRVKRRGERHARRWFVESVWPRAEKFATTNPPITDPTEARVAIMLFQTEASVCSWSGTFTAHRGNEQVRVRAGSARRAFEGIVEIALKGGTVAPYLSERTLALVCGFGHRRTVRNALDVLIHLGWIERVSKGAGSSGSVYRLLLQGPRRNVADDPQRHHRRWGCISLVG
jgi:hypothetical protein